MNLFIAPFLARIETAELAVVTFIQHLVAELQQVRLSHFRRGQREGVLSPNERRGESEVEHNAVRFQRAPGVFRLFNSRWREIDIALTCKQVLEVPFALAMA